MRSGIALHAGSSLPDCRVRLLCTALAAFCWLNQPNLPCSQLHCRYASYCANVARTYFVDPNKEQEAQYAALQEAQAAAVAALVEGAPMSAAYEAVVSTLKVSQLRCTSQHRGCRCCQWGRLQEQHSASFCPS